MNQLQHCYKKRFFAGTVFLQFVFFAPPPPSVLLPVSRPCWRAHGPPAPEVDTSCG